MSKAIDLRAFKALSKEQRERLTQEIQKDGDLWNAVNGVGGLSEFSDNARLQGTIMKEGIILPKAEIQILKEESLIHRLRSNEQGYFSINLTPDNYTVVILNEENKEEIAVKALKGVTSSINHDFKLSDAEASS